jgi:hypothetical protein
MQQRVTVRVRYLASTTYSSRTQQTNYGRSSRTHVSCMTTNTGPHTLLSLVPQYHGMHDVQYSKVHGLQTGTPSSSSVTIKTSPFCTTCVSTAVSTARRSVLSSHCFLCPLCSHFRLCIASISCTSSHSHLHRSFPFWTHYSS